MHSLALAHSAGREVFFDTAKPHQKTDLIFFASADANSAKLSDATKPPAGCSVGGFLCAVNTHVCDMCAENEGVEEIFYKITTKTC